MLKIKNKMMNIKIVSMAAIALLMCSCGGKKSQSAANAGKAEQVPTVKIVEAQKEIVPLDEKYSVTFQANVINNIAPQSGARITEIRVDVGDFVKKGQVLAQMDRSQLEQAELQLNNLKSEYDRSKALYEKGGVSKSDFESIELQYKVANTTYENLLTNTILKSPIDGVVTARNYDCGDMYTMSSPLFVVQQIDPVKALVAVSEKNYSLLKKGIEVEFVPEALGGKTYVGKVSRVYPTIDATTHTITAEVTIDNPKFELRPGMYSSARVIFGKSNVVVVPDTAVQKQQGSGVRTVYIYKSDGTVESKIVELGRHIGSNYVILSGVEAGENVVVSGQSALKSGIKVEVIK